MYCKNCGNILNSESRFCSSCGTKQQIQNLQPNNMNLKKKDKLTKITTILGICAGVLFGLSIITLFSGILICFPDPVSDTSSDLSFDIFGECAGTMIVVSVILVILIVILNVIKSNKNKRSC